MPIFIYFFDFKVFTPRKTKVSLRREGLPVGTENEKMLLKRMDNNNHCKKQKTAIVITFIF